MSQKPTSKKSQSPDAGPSKWWSEGIRFQCQGSGQCCVSRGEFGFVYLTKDERQKMAAFLDMPTAAFTRKFCKKTDGVWHLKDGKGPECVFLKGNRCEVYKVRPTQCRTWPFWPEVMGAKQWAKDVESYCPGVGKGRLIKADEIDAALQAQVQWETDLSMGK